MTSERQILANRRNGAKSTGPRTRAGKQRARKNALRHGLTAETIIGVLEDPEEYRKFEAEIVTDLAPTSTVEYALVARLASLFWRLRRATAIETGLLQIQAENLVERTSTMERWSPSVSPELRVIYSLLQPEDSSPRDNGRISISTNGINGHMAQYQSGPKQLNGDAESSAAGIRNLAHCFLRLANLNNEILERINRYEKMLWRQVAHIMIVLKAK